MIVQGLEREDRREDMKRERRGNKRRGRLQKTVWKITLCDQMLKTIELEE